MPNSAANTSSVDIMNLTVSLANSMSLLTQKTCLQNITSTIPTFNGEDPSLIRFAQTLEDGLTLIPEGTETEYLAIVLTKLVGPARRCTLEHKFTTVKALIQHLKKRFAPGKSLSYYQVEIAKLHIREGESLRQYIDRTSHLVYCTRGAMREKYEAHAEEFIKLMEKDVIENFIDGLPDRISLKVSAILKDIKNLEDAYDAVLQIDKRLRNRRQSPRSESPSRWSRRDSYDQDSRYRDREVSYPLSPSKYDRHRDQRTRPSGFEEEREGRASAWTLRHRSPSGSPSNRSDSSIVRDGEKRYTILKNSDRNRMSKSYCWHCGTSGHDGKFCKNRPRSPRFQRDSRDSSVESNKSLNFDRAHRTGDTMSENKEVRQRTVRFEEKPSSRKLQHHKSKSKSQNWNQARENF
ncbi:uncharacterized protein LOC143217665 [Lasioglossum baleicum]|uniref:uncharacterized protein LOC143217665 n=1 Tax=Lasioglossum baleicum TaxID=434251 RepID=UPI003FCD555F